MGKRGPQSTGLRVIEKQEKQRPAPPVGMSEQGRVAWKRITGAYPADFFKPQHLDLLRMYCESSAANKILMKKYIDSGYEETQYLRSADKMAARCQGLSVKLGINVNNRMAHRGQTGEPAKPKTKRDGLLFGGQNQ